MEGSGDLDAAIIVYREPRD